MTLMIEKWDLAAVYMLKYASGLECEIVVTFLIWFIGVLLKVKFTDFKGVIQMSFEKEKWGLVEV